MSRNAPDAAPQPVEAAEVPYGTWESDSDDDVNAALWAAVRGKDGAAATASTTDGDERTGRAGTAAGAAGGDAAGADEDAEQVGTRHAHAARTAHTVARDCPAARRGC